MMEMQRISKAIPSRKSNGPPARPRSWQKTPIIAPTEPASAKETLVLMSIRFWR